METTSSDSSGGRGRRRRHFLAPLPLVTPPTVDARALEELPEAVAQEHGSTRCGRPRRLLLAEVNSSQAVTRTLATSSCHAPSQTASNQAPTMAVAAAAAVAVSPVRLRQRSSLLLLTTPVRLGSSRYRRFQMQLPHWETMALRTYQTRKATPPQMPTWAAPSPGATPPPPPVPRPAQPPQLSARPL